MKIKRLYSAHNFESFTPISSGDDFDAIIPGRKTPTSSKAGHKFFKAKLQPSVKDGPTAPAKDTPSLGRKGRLTSTPLKASLPQLSISKEKVSSFCSTSAKENTNSKSVVISTARQVLTSKKPTPANSAAPRGKSVISNSKLSNLPSPRPRALSKSSISTKIEKKPPSSPSSTARATSSAAPRKPSVLPMAPPEPVIPPSSSSASPVASPPASDSPVQASQADNIAAPTKRDPGELEGHLNIGKQLCFCAPILRASESVIVEEIRKMVRAEFKDACRVRSEAIARHIENKFEDLKEK